MHEPTSFEPRRTRETFEALLKVGPGAHHSLVDAVVEAVREDAWNDPTCPTTGPVVDGDATATFDALLRGAGSFNRSCPPVYLGGKPEALHARCLVSVLVELTRQHVATRSDGVQHVWGWEGLSRGAQDWCWNLFLCVPLSAASRDTRLMLFEAKNLLAQLVVPLLECPPLGRTPEANIGEVAALDTIE